jgi:hypothetical protein
MIEQDSSIDEGKFKFGTAFCSDGVLKYVEEPMDGRNEPYQSLYHFAESPDCPLRQTWFLNPETVHIIAANGKAGEAASERFSSRTPEDGVKTAETLADDGLRLEQETTAAEEFKLWNVNPVTDTSLNAVEFIEGAATKETVNVALVP